MKKLCLIAACVSCAVVLLFSSCDFPQISFDENYLIGKWTRPSTLSDGQDCYRYNADYTGATWDTGEVAGEEEAQPFTWSLEGATLTQIHQGEMGQKVPKVYTLKTLNDSTLSYRDDYGVSFTFIKVK